MKKLSVLITIVLLLGAFAGISSSHAEKDGYFKGVWLSTVKNLDFPSDTGLSENELKGELDDVISTCKSVGINAIFFQVRPCSDALYKSSVFPWSAVLSGTQGVSPDGGFDPLDYIITAAHKNGIELHAWINPYRICMTSDGAEKGIAALSEDNPAAKHPEYRVECSDGGVYYNPALEEVRALITSGVAEIVENYDVDGIHFDDYFYPYGVTDYPDAEDYEKYGAGFADIADFRRNNVNMLVKQVSEKIHKINPKVSFGISPFGIWDNKRDNPLGSDTTGMSSYREIYADSKKWVESGWVDYICPQVYWAFETPAAPFDTLVNWWNGICSKSGVRLYIGHALYKLGSGEEGFDSARQIERQIELCRSKADGSVFFSYSTVKNNLLGCRQVIATGRQDIQDITFAQNAEKYGATASVTSGSVEITSPEDGYTTALPALSITGMADASSPLTVSGNPVPLTEHGYFSVYVGLKTGENRFDFVSGGARKTVTITRAAADTPAPELVNGVFVKDSAYPSGDITLYSGSLVKLSVAAVSGSKISAEFAGKKIGLSAENDGENGVCTYSATVSAPVIFNGEADYGSVCFYAETSSGVSAFGGGALKVITASITLYTQNECYVYDSVYGGSMMDNYQQPAGAKVRAVAFMNGMYKLESGKWINADNVAPQPPYQTELDIDDKKYTRVDIAFDNLPSYQCRVTAGGTLVMQLFGCAVTPEITASSAQVDATLVGSSIVFTDAVGGIEGYYVKSETENTLTVWVYKKQGRGIAGKVIALDAGHGGDDTGALGPAGKSGACEDDLNLSLSYLLAKKLKAAGAQVCFTRETEDAVPLATRAGLIRENHPDISISLHHNSVDIGSDFNKASGVVVLYSRETSLPLAKSLSEYITDGLDIPNNGCKAQSLNVCRDYRYPCVLLECGFVCNPSEYETLLTDDYKNKLCDNIVRSLEQYFG